MRNHVHGIIVIAKTSDSGSMSVGAQHAAPLQEQIRNNVQRGTLGAIVRSFKSAVTKRINEMRGTPGIPVWQRNYLPGEIP